MVVDKQNSVEAVLSQHAASKRAETIDELMQMRNALLACQKMYEEVDTNGDGSLSREEVAEYMYRHGGAHSDSMTKMIDRNAQKPRTEVDNDLQEVEADIAEVREHTVQLAKHHSVDGGIRIGAPGRQAHISSFDIAKFMSRDTTEAYVQSPAGDGLEAVIFDEDSENTTETTVMDRVAIIDMQCVEEASATQRTSVADAQAKYPCEKAMLAQRSGAKAVIFVYSGEELRGNLLPISPLDSVWIPVVAITLSSANGVLKRVRGKLYFNKDSDGKTNSQSDKRSMLSTMDGEDLEGEGGGFLDFLDSESAGRDAEKVGRYTQGFSNELGVKASIIFDQLYLQTQPNLSIFGASKCDYQIKISILGGSRSPSIEVGDRVSHQVDTATQSYGGQSTAESTYQQQKLVAF